MRVPNATPPLNRPPTANDKIWQKKKIEVLTTVDVTEAPGGHQKYSSQDSVHHLGNMSTDAAKSTEVLERVEKPLGMRKNGMRRPPLLVTAKHSKLTIT